MPHRKRSSKGYAFQARARGAQLCIGCEVIDIETKDGKIREVVTDQGLVATDTVICAAGAWSRSCGEMVGLDLPVTPLRRQVLFTESMPDLPPDLPMTIDFASSFYFHREGLGLLLGMSDPEETPGFSVETSDDWMPALMAVASSRAPRIADVGIRGGWAGLYEMTPDHNAIIGEAEQVSRFLYATGFSGHGFLARTRRWGDPPRSRPAPAGVHRCCPAGGATFDRSSMRPEFNVV